MPVKKFDADVPDDDLWTRRINAIGSWVLKIAQIAGPILMGFVLYLQNQNHKDTVAQIDTAKTAVATEVKTGTKAAVDEAKEVKKELVVSTAKRDEDLGQIKEGQKANLQAWRAYHTGDKEDMNKATEVIAKVIQEK
jgi:hypothetical protein